MVVANNKEGQIRTRIENSNVLLQRTARNIMQIESLQYHKR